MLTPSARAISHVIDGNTTRVAQQLIRLVGCDTAEIGEHARCTRELDRQKAPNRLRADRITFSERKR
jgi:endonuclease YncB( thermonuclease family)